MGCPCNRSKAGADEVWVVRLPGPEGRTKSYSYEISARAMVDRTPGAVLIPPQGATVS